MNAEQNKKKNIEFLNDIHKLKNLAQELLILIENDLINNDKIENTKWPDVLIACKFEGLAAALMENCALIRIDILNNGILLALSYDPAVESIAFHFMNNRNQELSEKLNNYFKCHVDLMFSKRM